MITNHRRAGFPKEEEKNQGRRRTGLTGRNRLYRLTIPDHYTTGNGPEKPENGKAGKTAGPAE